MTAINCQGTASHSNRKGNGIKALKGEFGELTVEVFPDGNIARAVWRNMCASLHKLHLSQDNFDAALSSPQTKKSFKTEIL
ncbi:hypothetical protein, partial [Polaromonas sp.]|uniref:hypothetical protein n=1 Tax=Polaromonas sp. TaxID=1869339 RepID=UPI00182AC3CD